MDTITVTMGRTLDQTITIMDSQDNPITTYSGTEALQGTIRPGRSITPNLTFTPTWLSPANGTVSILINQTTWASASPAITPGQYLISLTLTENTTLNVYDIYDGLLVVNYAAGTDTLPATYCAYDDLLSYAPWIQKLQTEVQVAGFAIERGIARGWLDQVIINHFMYQFLGPQMGQPGFMPLNLFPSTTANASQSLWLRDQLNLDYLVRRQNVVEITAKKSIYYVCRSQLDALNDKQERLATFFGADADRMALALRAEITLGTAHPNNADTWPSLVVDCGRASLRG